MTPTLQESDLERIRARIARAEDGTSAEIVPYVVARSDRYEVVLWRGAAAAATLFLVLTLVIYLFYQGWMLGWLYTGIGLAIGLVVSLLVGVTLVVLFQPVFLLIAGRKLLARRVRSRAERAFIREGVFRTEDRTGILIMVSLWERRIEVLTDEGINAAVESKEWMRVVEAARSELRRGDLAEALISAVDVCDEIVRASGLKARKGDLNELDDALRFGADPDE